MTARSQAWIAGPVIGAILLAVLLVTTARCSSPEQDVGATGQVGPTTVVGPMTGQPGFSAGADPSGRPGVQPAPAAGDGTLTCPPATVTAFDTDSLKRALADAKPGDSIQLADGTYRDKFVAARPGTAERPIFLCGGSGAVIDGGSVKGGYAFHLNGASYWRLVGFTVRNGQKGVMADGVQRAVIQGLTVEQIGDEAIHLRNFSSDNMVQGNTIRNTGLRRDKFGEGIYIGSAQSNWCTITGCKPDKSDRNIVRDNTISDTTAESIDIKEGTTGGQAVNNRFDGAKLSGSHSDSWVDVKGNGWLIKGNFGRNALVDGFQTHEVVDGWGTDNVFRANTAEVNGSGWGFHFAPVRANKVTCDNKVTGAAKGMANVPCV